MTLAEVVRVYRELGIDTQIDYNKFYLYSIITHSTAIEGSTVTELENQLLFDEGITAQGRSFLEQMMNLDLKNAYEWGMAQMRQHPQITIEFLCALAARVMQRTGSEYNTIAGSLSAAKGDLRLLNVSAGYGGRSYLNYLKVPARLQQFCDELNRRRATIDATDIQAVYELSFWTHFELVTIHPWADGNGRMSRLLMNLLQMEFGVLPVKVLKEDKAAYIQALVDAREQEDTGIFIDCMMRLHSDHLKDDIDRYLSSVGEKMVDKSELQKEMAGKWSIKPSLAAKLADVLEFASDKDELTTEQIVSHFGFTPTTAKRYLRQLTEFGYLVSRGGNRNRTYAKR